AARARGGEAAAPGRDATPWEDPNSSACRDPRREPPPRSGGARSRAPRATEGRPHEEVVDEPGLADPDGPDEESPAPLELGNGFQRHGIHQSEVIDRVGTRLAAQRPTDARENRTRVVGPGARQGATLTHRPDHPRRA